MIQHFIILNTVGLPRLTKHYTPLPIAKKQALLRGVFSLVSSRPAGSCCFVEDEQVLGPGAKLVYRGFATLYFIAICDAAESELGLLDLIQVFVETLDKVFENVCELDIIFNSPKVHQLLDEIIVGGTVLETDGNKVLQQVREYERAEKVSEMERSNVGAGVSGGSAGNGPNKMMNSARQRFSGGMNQILGKPAFG